jgi:hypothetical protein
MWRGIRIKNPPNHFLADPFVITEAGRDYCFVEDYNFKIERACISVYEIEEKKAVRLGEAIAEPFHMSFPYLFRFKSKLYMVPETYENKDIRLYECVKFPLEWKLCKLIMSGISAVDTMIFEHGGLWWLFTNIALSSSDNEHCSELSIFYSENPLSENWRPHLKNPVIVDPTKARNAGILFGKDNIYRVSQRYGFTQYGKGFSINKICLLTASSYEEQQISLVEPNYFDKIIGTHHLHCRDNISVFDYVEKSRIDI